MSIYSFSLLLDVADHSALDTQHPLAGTPSTEVRGSAPQAPPATVFLYIIPAASLCASSPRRVAVASLVFTSMIL